MTDLRLHRNQKTFVGCAVFLFFTLFSNICVAQKGNLLINFYWDGNAKQNEFQLHVIREQDTIASAFPDFEIPFKLNQMDTGYYQLVLIHLNDSLTPGIYSIVRIIQIKPNMETEIYYDLSEDYSTHLILDTLTNEAIIKERNEFEMRYYYGDQHWGNQKTANKWNAGMGFLTSAYFSPTKHIGFIAGGGFSLGYSPNRISNSDTNHAILPKFDYYYYLTGDIEIKLRLSTGNQQLRNINPGNVFFDFGVRYQLPIVFKRVEKFNYDDKHVHGFLNNFSDLKSFVNIGNQNYKVYFEYSFFNYLKGNNPMLPKYTLGIKLNFFTQY
jgi:hypothetical protein